MQRSETTKLKLVTTAQTGNEEAFAHLVRGCEGTLYAAALAITRNEHDAQDAVQDAIFRGWDKLHTLREPAYFTTWMTRIVIRASINIGRKRRPSAPLLLDIPTGDARLDERMDIRRAIETLDENTRLCTVLYYFEDMPIEQIAQITGARVGTIKSRLFRARAKLRSVLEGYDHVND